MATHEKLFRRKARPAELLIRKAHVLDPRTGIDEPHDVLIRDGEIAELGAPGTLSASSETPTTEAAGKHLFPAFVDPHVHLRTPGQEYKENIETGTTAAAVGGFCQVIAMPNTSPTVDQISVLKALIGDRVGAGRRAHGLPRVDHDRSAGQRADGDGRAQRRRCAGLHG